MERDVARVAAHVARMGWQRQAARHQGRGQAARLQGNLRSHLCNSGISSPMQILTSSRCSCSAGSQAPCSCGTGRWRPHSVHRRSPRCAAGSSRGHVKQRTHACAGPASLSSAAVPASSWCCSTQGRAGQPRHSSSSACASPEVWGAPALRALLLVGARGACAVCRVGMQVGG